MNSYDLAVIGSGSAALAGVIRGRELGAHIVVIERETVGGTCVNIGCVPSKTLIRAGELNHAAAQPTFRGLTTSSGPVDLHAAVEQKDELVATLRREKYEDLLAQYDVDLVRGTARFADAHSLTVDGRLIEAGAYLVATGASPSVPGIPGLAEAGYRTSTEALNLTSIPGTVAVIGANAVGLELGQAMLHLGSRVAFFDVLDRIMPFEEPEISAALTEVLQERGADIHTCAHIVRVERDGDKRVIVATIGDDQIEQRFAADEIVVATGRRPNSDHLMAEAGKIDITGSGAVIVDEHFRTSNPLVFAAGDVTGAPQFVYVAAQQGAVAAENALTSGSERVYMDALPRVTFTTPQVASVGMTEEAGRAAGHRVQTSVLPMSAVPRALVNHDVSGLVKLVADEDTDRLLGAHVLADGAGDVIQAAVFAVKARMTITDIAATWSPYLTMSEALKLAAQTFTRDVSKLSCCA